MELEAIPTSESLERSKAVARPIMLVLCPKKDTCIRSTAITIGVLEYYGINAIPFPCSLVVCSAAHVNEPDLERLRIGCIGVGRRTEDVGHLVALVESKYLVDTAIDQVERPEKSMLFRRCAAVTASSAPWSSGRRRWKPPAPCWCDHSLFVNAETHPRDRPFHGLLQCYDALLPLRRGAGLLCDGRVLAIYAPGIAEHFGGPCPRAVDTRYGRNYQPVLLPLVICAVGAHR
jgi:hypothetical protein